MDTALDSAQSAAATPPSRWGRATQDDTQALRELAASYWYCAYAWWRRTGLEAGEAAAATLTTFTRWLTHSPPRAAHTRGSRMREWLPARLGELARLGVQPEDEPEIAIDPAWAEQRFTEEPEGDADAIFHRRWALTILEFAMLALRSEYEARGQEALFAEAEPFAGFQGGEEDRYTSAAARQGITAGAMRKAVFDFRKRHRELLRAFVSDTLLDPADVESEITALLCACDVPGTDAAAAPLPTAIRHFKPDELLARAMQAVQMTHTGTGGQWTPPSDDEIARLFPQYEMRGMLGRGGMGAVYKGRQVTLDRFVAIKLLPLEVSVDREFADRFVREARAMARLNHPNILDVYDFGSTSEGHLYFVMEFVEGANLAEMIHAGERGVPITLSSDQALGITGQVCSALAYAHGKGIVHRDIKPANVMVDLEGTAKVADFGLARLTEPDTELMSRTVTGTVMGTPDYMAPEQKRGMNVDHRADIYSVGVMLYEMLCKETPQGVFEPPSMRAGCDPSLDQIVIKAMNRDPEKRYQSTQEMQADVEAARTPIPSPTKSSTATVKLPMPTASQTPRVVMKAITPPPPETRKKSKLLLYGSLAAAVVVAIVAVVLWMKPSTEPSSPSPVATGPDVPPAFPPEPPPNGPPKLSFVITGLIDLARDRASVDKLTKANEWTFANGRLAYLSDGGAGKIMLPVDIGGARDYTHEFDFRALGQTSAFTLNIPTSPTQQCGLDFYPGVKVELSMKENAPQKIGDWPAGKDKGGRLFVRVKFGGGAEGRISVWLDGQPIAHWEGPLRAFGQPLGRHPDFPGMQIASLVCLRDSYEFTN